MPEPVAWLAEVFASIQGEGSWVGRRQIFVRFAGCRQRCAYCDTVRARASRPPHWTLTPPRPGARPQRRVNPVPLAALLKLVGAWQKQFGPFHSVSLTGGEPLEQSRFLHAWLPALKRAHPELKVLLETNGLEPEALPAVLAGVDHVAADLKLASATGQAWRSAVHRRFLRTAARKEGCVKVVVTPRTTEPEVRAAARLARGEAPHWDFVLQPDSRAAWTGPAQRARLGRWLAIALRENSTSRLIPQIHRLLRIP